MKQNAGFITVPPDRGLSRSPMPHKRNIASYAEGSFQPHGQIELWPEGSLVLIEAEGPFNLEAALALRRAYAELLASMPQGRPFVIAGRFSNSLLASPDALDAFRDMLAMASSHGMAPWAVGYAVAPEVVGRELMLPVLERLYAAQGRRFAVFEQWDEARRWALSELACAAAAPA